jgi:hypothetical protein
MSGVAPRPRRARTLRSDKRNEPSNATSDSDHASPKIRAVLPATNVTARAMPLYASELILQFFEIAWQLID